MPDLNIGLIGNCQISALIDRDATVVWGCLPQFDSDPAFCRLLRREDESDLPGLFDIELIDQVRSEQAYVQNTAILTTTLTDAHGGSVQITDVAPRYEHLGRIFAPVMLLRRVQAIHGSPRIRIRLRPAINYGEEQAPFTMGSNHIEYRCSDVDMRLTTNVSLTHIVDENAFIVNREFYLILGPNESVRESCGDCFYQHYRATRQYWQRYTRTLSIPFEWQEAVIRAAITLKLCTFEDTGAVVAALTTSVPEAADSGRNWDYRYCWLRDSYFVVQALNRLGATKTMERYIGYMMNIVAEAEDAPLKPLYGISGRSLTDERIVETLAGYRGMGPVRRGNQAYEQIQHDVYGAVVLSATQLFFDKRLVHEGAAIEFERLEMLGEHARQFFNAPDAGLWEYRGRQRVHSFSSMMCWAACDRLGRIAAQMGKSSRHDYWTRAASEIKSHWLEQAWDAGQQAFTESFGRPELDASLLTIGELGFLPADDPRFISTVERLGERLKRGQHMFRYDAPDDFGAPENAFNICTFWYIDALARIGRRDEAREMFENMLSLRNPLGMLSEDIEPKTGELWGNFPQTYSMAGIINAAVRLSKPWEEAI
ncbi:MAG: glycoside hydrolase family 15 protein [Pseudomonadota bacterium]